MATDITVTTATRPASGLGQITPEPYVQHSDVLGSPSQGPPEASAVAAIARLPDVGAAAGGLVLTEIKTTIPADNMPPPSSFQPPVQVSVTGVDLGHPGLGPLATARLVSSRAFAPDLYLPMARAHRDGEDAEFGRACDTGSLQWLWALLFSGHGRPSRMHCLDPGQVISPSRGHWTAPASTLVVKRLAWLYGQPGVRC